MILVRLTMQTKWGMADKVVDEYKSNLEMMRRVLGSDVHGRILTDLSGPFHTVVQEVEVENLAEWERIRTALFNNPELQEAQSDGENLFESGSTEFFTIEGTF
jgi:hypothetical protein